MLTKTKIRATYWGRTPSAGVICTCFHPPVVCTRLMLLQCWGEKLNDNANENGWNGG
jgi:hypothetical protein